MSLHAATPSKRPRGSSRQLDPDVGLMLRVQRDEPGAFAELLKQYWTRIFGRLFRCFRDRQEAEDLCQEVFLRLYRSRKSYAPTAKLGTWLYHITQNVARNAIRSRRRRPVQRWSSLPAEAPWDQAEQPRRNRIEPPSRVLERRELARLVRAAVSDLACRQRTALELHQFQDHTYVEVAQAMAMSPKAAKSLLYRARNQLRILLEGVVLA